jgi:glucokinase
MHAGMTPSELIGLPRTDFAGIDVGATKVHMRYHNPATGTVEELRLTCAEFSSLEHLLCACFVSANCLPAYSVAGIAGRLDQNGDVQMTNLPSWPLFRRTIFQDALGIRLVTVNDMLAAVAGVGETPAAKTLNLTPWLDRPATSATLVVSVGTGVGSACMDSSGGLHPAESGHLSWQPMTDMEWDYQRYVRGRINAELVSVEQSIGGLRGFDYLYDFVSAQQPPTPAVRDDVVRRRSEATGIGPSVTSGALSGDPCCRTAMGLFGAIFGQFLRNLALLTLVDGSGGTIYLTSGVLQAESVCGHLVHKTAFYDRFLGRGAVHQSLMEQIPVFIVTDPLLTANGAFALARKLPGKAAATG